MLANTGTLVVLCIDNVTDIPDIACLYIYGSPLHLQRGLNRVIQKGRLWKGRILVLAIMNKGIGSASLEGPQDSVTESAICWKTKSLSRQDTGLVELPLQEPLTRVLNPAH